MAVDGFRFSAEHISQITGGHLKLKTFNNWATNSDWVSELDKPSPGHPRLFSRLNVLEAVIASEMMKLGISRSECKWLIRAIIDMEGGLALEEREAFRPAASGWYLWASVVGHSEARHLSAAGVGPLDGIASSMARDGVTLVLPLSSILEKIDALDPERQVADDVGRAAE